jgi:primosomal protein N' (replication factor Y)
MQRDLFPPEGESAEQKASLFADVVFDRPLDHAFTYAVGDELRSRIAVGKRVRAPFGRGDKATVGYCVRLSDTPPERAVKELVDVLDDEPLLTDDLLRLTRWMADYYLCGWGQVLNAVVPAGAREKAGTRKLTFIEAVPEAELPPHPNPPPHGGRGREGTSPQEGRESLLSPSLRVGEGRGGGIELTAKQTAVLELLRKAGKVVELRQLARQAKCGSGPIEALIHKGMARRVARRVDQFVDSTQEEAAPAGPIVLNDDQRAVWDQLEPALKQGGFHAFLLHGVTGSGKTEIYLRAIEEVIRQGKEALVLVPEISLTPQTIQRFRGRCGEVAVLHSHLGNAERGGHWRRVAAGQAQVIVGARSAVFAPAKRLGLLVIDEEHETTFKQDTTPRYHGRDVAVMRARLENIPILLGSASPSLESWHNAQRGHYTLLSLPQRVLERPLPEVGLIDLRHQLPRRGRPSAISDGVEHALRHALKEGGQVMLLLNRRGFSTHIHCPSCGHIEACRFCDLALTYHKERDILLCHYCGFEQEPQKNCPLCGQSAVRYQGLGTEKLQAEIEERFPGYVVRRMDSDTMRRPGSHARVLSAFRRGLIHILLGTQMIAKGLDFPNVTLVGVVNADVGLHVPDFRSAERTFQLLSQVAGRAGRGPRGGRVLVQTFTPEHPCIALAATHDYAGFVAAEMKHRREHNYPPFQRLARIIVRSRDQQAVSAFADLLADAFQSALQAQTASSPPEVRVLGPAEAPVFRLKGYYRFHFQLQSPSPGALHQLLRAVLPAQRAPAGVEFTLDVDPFNML